MEQIKQAVEQPNTTVNPMNEIKPQAIPDKYSKLGIVTGYRPVPAHLLRMWVLGPRGQGKTSFVAGIARNLVLDFDEGAWGVPYPRAHRVYIKDAEHLHKVVDMLVADAKEGKRIYDRVTFDTVDQVLDILSRELAKNMTNFEGDDITQWGQKGAGWMRLKNAVWAEIRKLEIAGYAWTCVGHVTEKTVTINRQERTVVRPVLFDTLSKLIGRNCDVVATIYAKSETEQIFREVQGRKVSGGSRDITKIYFDATTISNERNGGTGKIRGIPMTRAKVELPDPMTKEHGWDKFVALYDNAVAEVQAAIKESK